MEAARGGTPGLRSPGTGASWRQHTCVKRRALVPTLRLDASELQQRLLWNATSRADDKAPGVMRYCLRGELSSVKDFRQKLAPRNAWEGRGALLPHLQSSEGSGAKPGLRQALGNAHSYAKSSSVPRVLSRSTGDFSETSLAKNDLKEALATVQRGLVQTEKCSTAIAKAIDALVALQDEGSSTTDEKLDATWRMLWTTEKETLFILQWAPIFGTQAGEVYQPINTARRTLSNVITFPPSGSFLVNAEIEVVDKRRVAFTFTKATLTLPDRTLNLPPFGKGWFENVYLDDNFRISKDSRGDTLVTERCVENNY